MQVNDTGAGSWLPIAELLACDKSALEPPNAVKMVQGERLAAEVLEKDAQVLDCRAQAEFVGVKADTPVSGHLLGAINVPFEDIFAPDSDDGSTFILHKEQLKELFADNGLIADAPVTVIATDEAEAATVATALLMSGYESVAFLSEPLSEDLVAQLPEKFTKGIAQPESLVFADDDGRFDLSPTTAESSGETTTVNTDAAAEELGKTYAERMNGTDEFGDKIKPVDPKKRKDNSVEEVVWVTEGRRYFDMPAPMPKPEFLEASSAIYRVVSFVLAPFGFPESLHEKLTLSEVKSQCGSLFQDVIEVCSDLIYQHKGLTEGAMAMSVHKWVEDIHDSDCSDQVKAINDIWAALYDPPRIVEVPDLDESRVLEIATELKAKLLDKVAKRTPWAFDKVEPEDDTLVEIKEPVDEGIEAEDVSDPKDSELPDENEENHTLNQPVAAGGSSPEPNSADEETIKTEEDEDESNEKVNLEEASNVEDIDEPTEQSMAAENIDNVRVPGDDREGTPEDEASSKKVEEVDAEVKEPAKKKIEFNNNTPWSCMYPTVVYTLGFIPGDSDEHLRKLSTLQIKSFIQAVAEAAWDVVGDIDNLGSVQFEALCGTLKEAYRTGFEDCKSGTEDALYVMQHFLTRSLVIEERHVSSLFSVRDALNDGNRKARSRRHIVALAAYAKAFEHLPIFHKSLDKVLVGRSHCFVELGLLGRAKTEAELALKLNPFSAGAYDCLAKVEEKSSHPHESMQHYVTAFILDGSRSQEHAESIDRVSRLVGRDVAKGLFEEMVKVHSLPSSWLVDSYFESFEHDADYAICLPTDMAKKADTDQSDVDALTLLHRAVYHKRAKNYGEMQRDVWALVAMDMAAAGLSEQQQGLALNLHASLLYVVGDVHAAIEVINKSLELHPTSVNGLVKKGGFLAEIGATDEATSCFAEAMELDPNDADVHLHMGQMELLDGNYQAAVQCLRRCITRSDALPVTHVSYGMALYKSGSIYQANDVFDGAIAAFPESAEVHLFHGEVLADQGDYALAMRRFLRALELSPRCPLPFLNAGRVYVGTNDPMRAIAHFEQALEIDPRCSSAHLDIAQVLFAQGRTDEAFSHFAAAASCCRFLPEVEEVCSCEQMAKMQLKVTEILGVELRHIMRSK